MGLLKRDKAPDELPELALESPVQSKPFVPPEVSSTLASSPVLKKTENDIVENKEEKVVSNNKEEKVDYKKEDSSSIPDLPKESFQKKDVSEVKSMMEKELEPKKEELVTTPSQSEDLNLEEIKSKLANHEEEDSKTPKFFDQILNDINDGIQDLGKMEDWYKNKFSSQDIVSNMKGYWEGNKADIIIQSFGAEYKKRITENIKNLQALEEEWRVIYFQLIKKEEEMKKVEQELKSTLSEFVELCKNRKHENEEDKEAEKQED